MGQLWTASSQLTLLFTAGFQHTAVLQSIPAQHDSNSTQGFVLCAAQKIVPCMHDWILKLSPSQTVKQNLRAAEKPNLPKW